MSLAPTIEKFMKTKGVPFDLAVHDRAVAASHIAQKAHVPGDKLAKGVLVKSESGYLVAVVPASRRLDLAELSHRLHERLGLAAEAETHALFKDCDPGAVPAVGTAYAIRTIVDKRLDDLDDVYFEAGDHRTLVHVSRSAFARLMGGEVEHAAISRPH